ncbi:hypothetical protein [Robiginitalea sp.]|uniref:hypothetical protein n=1 Tax=Robiginitalea sp. TaxID=1902411 RepID=UPI003C73BF3F
MNKILLTVLLVLALVLIGYNTTVLDFEKPFEGESLVALICIIASLCAIILLLIFTAARKIQKKIDEES